VEDKIHDLRWYVMVVVDHTRGVNVRTRDNERRRGGMMEIIMVGGRKPNDRGEEAY